MSSSSLTPDSGTLRDLLEAELKADEGLRLVVYDDATGAVIKPGTLVKGHPTVGYGRALDVHGITADEAQFLLAGSAAAVLAECSQLPWFASLNTVRQMVIACMVYQMGLAGALAFRGMIAAIQSSNWETAASEMLDSEWARQTPARAHKLAERMRTGVWKHQSGALCAT